MFFITILFPQFFFDSMLNFKSDNLYLGKYILPYVHIPIWHTTYDFRCHLKWKFCGKCLHSAFKSELPNSQVHTLLNSLLNFNLALMASPHRPHPLKFNKKISFDTRAKCYRAWAFVIKKATPYTQHCLLIKNNFVLKAEKCHAWIGPMRRSKLVRIKNY